MQQTHENLLSPIDNFCKFILPVKAAIINSKAILNYTALESAEKLFFKETCGLPEDTTNLFM